MIEVVSFDNREKWDEIVKSFPEYDIYYLSGYLDAFRVHGDGTPTLWVYKDSETSAICVLMIRDISEDLLFKDKIPAKSLYDAITPYGYGGFVFSGRPSVLSQENCYAEFIEEAKKHNIISVFFRFHPIIGNADFARNSINVIDLGNTIHVDLASPEVIWQNITSKNRNMIRKAEKSGVIIKSGNSPELYAKFKEIYDLTMQRDNASSYYYFPNAFYNSIQKELKNNSLIFYAELEGQIIAASIILVASSHMIYHLSGSLSEYRSLAPSNLLLYKAALWGYENGFKEFHLGGGVGSGQDNLYKFKASFNRNSCNQFSIGKLIINQAEYNKLVSIREKSSGFNAGNSFFPLYRS